MISQVLYVGLIRQPDGTRLTHWNVVGWVAVVIW
jgi:hypothetical protein